MAEKDIGDIVGRHEGTTAPETGAVEPRGDVSAASSKPDASLPTDAAAAESVDPIAGLKSALDKERDARSRFEKESKAEARERKRLAQQLVNYERELQSLRSHVQRPDPKATEDAFWSGSPPEFIEQRLTAFEQRQAENAMRERVETSKEIARDRHEDFDEVEAAFQEAAEKNPTLWNGVLDKRLPAIEVYKRGKQILAGAESSPMSEIAKLRAEIAELRAGRDGGQTETDAETAEAPAHKPSIPRSNVGVRGTGVGKTTTWAGPTPIENVFGRRRSLR